MTDELRPSGWKNVLAVVAPIVSVLALFGGYVWQAAKYPDRDEFRSMQTDLKRVEIAVPVLQAKVEGLDNNVQKMSGQLDRIEGKQDVAQRRK